ncbi:hypothetical protein GCM10025768_20810 [Microbacterium pseudoresistens]|uniref:Protein-disulfide isomerase n=1 Tax=Microbacterium pseudoresistens TaxID=640634 RepID=A0A7Y9JMC7_9MICO|nr:thioredoxin domain-containing protein [Microbacterium pseudoresistens]NYD53378.1 protein-disulfide isomerase [Microbacterium pseudoresistens]
MSSDETPNVPTPRHSREAVREKAQQVHAQQSRARIMRRTIIALVAVVVVGAAGAGVAWAVGSAMSKPTASPSNMDDDGVVVREASSTSVAQGAPDAEATPSSETDGAEATPTPSPTVDADAVDIHIYVDYLSPGAGEFERANTRQLVSWIDQGAATVSYHPVSLLTANSNGTKYSLRAAAAAACVASFAPDKFYAFNHELLVNQPELDSDGRTDIELADLAQAVGVDDVAGVRGCIEKKSFTSWAKDATSRALEGPLPGSDDLVLNGAPMIVVNGQAYAGALDDPAEFSQFVLSIASDAYYSTPKPTQTPTETPAA